LKVWNINTICLCGRHYKPKRPICQGAKGKIARNFPKFFF
jgi:hypothetical protein